MISTRFGSSLRQMRDAGAWRPSHAKFLLEQVVDRRRNQRDGYVDSDHLHAAAAWLERAQDAAGDGGVAGRYRLRTGWTSAYPETTGYIIPTFLALGNEPECARFRDRAARAVDFLLPLQMAGGGFPGGELRGSSTGPSFFNTGQILAGLVSWHEATGDRRAIEAACRAADWLVGLQAPDGAFRRYLYHGVVTTYGTHASCWIAELGKYVGDASYLDAARRHVDWVLGHRDAETGWIDLCGFSPEHHRARCSVTHTIAYTLWGVLATARIVGYTEAASAVEQAALAIARRLELSGFLPGVLDSRWRPAASFSCLTGNAQMALVWFALYERSADSRFLNAALKALDLVKRAQPMRSADPGIRGGIPGSDPVWGDYIRMALPNWSAKFFIDALLEKRRVLATLPWRLRGSASLLADVPRDLPAMPVRAAASPPRIVILATPKSRKAVRMIREWEGFRPAAVVLISRRRPPLWTRLREKVREDGAAFILRKSPARGGAALDVDSDSGAADVRACCREARIQTLEVDSFESAAALDSIKGLRPDLFVFAGGAILREPLLAIPRLGTLNAHMGVLPFYRGMNVAEWACFHGDPAGCSVHLIDRGIDTGDILCVRPVAIEGARTIAETRRRIDTAQLALLEDVVRYVRLTGVLPPRRPQTAADGRQFFRMHGALLDLVERELASGVARQSAQMPTLNVAGGSRC